MGQSFLSHLLPAPPVSSLIPFRSIICLPSDDHSDANCPCRPLLKTHRRAPRCLPKKAFTFLGMTFSARMAKHLSSPISRHITLRTLYSNHIEVCFFTRLCLGCSLCQVFLSLCCLIPSYLYLNSQPTCQILPLPQAVSIPGHRAPLLCASLRRCVSPHESVISLRAGAGSLHPSCLHSLQTKVGLCV